MQRRHKDKETKKKVAPRISFNSLVKKRPDTIDPTNISSAIVNAGLGGELLEICMQ